METTVSGACYSPEDYKLYKIFSIVNLVISVSNITTNSILIRTLWKLKKLNTTSYKFIFIQCISDTVVGSALLLSRIVLHSVSFTHYCNLKRYSDIICDSLCMFSGIMVILIALDRYIHMRFLNRYSAWMTRRRAALLVICNVALSSLAAAAQVFAHLNNFYPLMNLVLNGIAILIISGASVAYFSAFRSLNRRTKQLEFQTARSNDARRKRNPTREFLKAMVSVLSALAFTFTPFVITSALVFVKRNNLVSAERTVIILYLTSRLFVCTNSSLNAVLYIILNRELRVYVLHIVSFGYLEKSSTDSQPQQPRSTIPLPQTNAGASL